WIYVPSAAAKAVAASGVNPWPRIPLIPETLTIKPVSCAILLSLKNFSYSGSREYFCNPIPQALKSNPDGQRGERRCVMSEVLLPGPETLSLDRTQPRDELCDRFEAAWKAASAAGPRPRIQDFLNAASEPERSALLCKLIGLDIHWRRRQGEEPRAE